MAPESGRRTKTSRRPRRTGVGDGPVRQNETPQAKRHEPVAGPGGEVLGRAEGLKPTVSQHPDAAAQGPSIDGIVSDEEYCCGAPRRNQVQGLAKFRAKRRVERRERLVEEPNRRPAHDRPGERDALTLPAGQFMGPAAQEGFESKKSDRITDG